MADPLLRSHPQHDPLILRLSRVREILARLERKLRENDPEKFPTEEDRELREALDRIGDASLSRHMLGYAVCVRGLTAPLTSSAWKRELAEEVDDAHRRALARLDTLERLARSAAGRLVLRVQAALHRFVLRRRPRPALPPEAGHDPHRSA